jgi:hypothetical protein
MGREYRDVVVFVALYLLVSLPPFLFFNRDVIGALRERVAPVDVVTVAVAGTGFVLVLAALILADEGIDRYNGFLFAPTDALSVLVGLSFLVAAASWWLVPELSFRLEWGLPLDLLLVVVLSCQTPMIVFLSLLTAIGRT